MIGKKFLAGLMLAALIGNGQLEQTEAAGMEVPKDIYEWVQSTERAGYYFNKQQMGYRVRPNGTLDLNILIVPTLKIYDPLQVEDVVAKRRWKMLSMTGYNDLVGAAEYLQFDLSADTVKVTEHDDLDSKWGTLSVEKPAEVLPLKEFSAKNVDGIFYRAILKYAEEHRDELIARSWGRLSSEDKAKLEAEKATLEPSPEPPPKELTKAEKRAMEKKLKQAAKKKDKKS